ncbi:MAG: DUF5666 domain-containing protein [Candidatus Gottesmanbacteria bacterium]|nr:DUF5666 domain-containing protein [Candidatus Gottesmanbacteria bacterium]
MKNNIILIVILSLLVGGGAGFFAGSQYQKSQRPSFGQFGARGASGAAGLRGRNGNGAAGTILGVDSNSMTVKLVDGSSKIVLLTAATSIDKAATAAASDLTVGERVSAFGTTNTDGSITATNVQINPIVRGPSGASGANGE